jgi:hypothetical protein
MESPGSFSCAKNITQPANTIEDCSVVEVEEEVEEEVVEEEED